MLKFAVAGAVLMLGSRRSQRAGLRRAARSTTAPIARCRRPTTAKRSSRKSATSSVRFRTRRRSTFGPAAATTNPGAMPKPGAAANLPQRHAAPLRMRRLRAAAEVRQPGGRQEGPQHRSFARHQHPDRGAGRHPRPGNQSPRHPQERDPPRRRDPAQPHHRRKRNPLRPARAGATRVEFITHHYRVVERPDTITVPVRRAASASAATAAACSVPTARCPALRVRG